MGGEAAGEVAAQHAVDAIKIRLLQETGTVARRLREAIAGANNEIYRLAEQNALWRGMGCVLTAALIDEGILHVGHVGDSRLYMVRDGQIKKITSDHSPVGQREDAGALTELEAMSHPRRNEVLRDIGSQLHKPDDPDFIEYLQVPFDDETAMILCSDGLSDLLPSNEILQILKENAGEPRDCVRSLIEKANSAGGKDNISVIVVEANGFAAAALRQTQKQRSQAQSARHLAPNPTPAKLSFLRHRWAFLCYGVLTGVFVNLLWVHFRKSVEETPKAPEIVQLPRVIAVEPGSPEYSTIAKALEAARPGDRIEVSEGEYNESVRLRDGVEILARSPGRTILRPTTSISDANAVITADGINRCEISGFVIRADSSSELLYGIRISSSNVNLSNMEVTGASRAGILIDGNSAGTVAASYVHANSGPGILVAGVANPLLIGNVVHANGATRRNASPGIYITGNSNPEVKRNVFSGNGAGAIRLQNQALKEKMMDNLFIGPRRPAGTVVVERNRQ